MTTLVACLLAGAAYGATPTYVTQTIDYPGSDYTDVRGINDEGAIVGTAHLPGEPVSFVFVYRPTTGFVRIAERGYDYGFGSGINNHGVIVGSQSHLNASGYQSSEIGWLFDNGLEKTFARRGSSYTEGRAINDAGMVTGFGEDRVACTTYPGCYTSVNRVGFLYDTVRRAWQDIPYPSGTRLMVPQGINTAGDVVGNVFPTSPGSSYGFLRDAGSGAMHLFRVNDRATVARAINDAHVITGIVAGASANQAFVSAGSGWYVLPLPKGAQHAYGEGINNKGQFSGYWEYFDANFNLYRHGFIASPAVMPSSVTPLGEFAFSTDVQKNVPLLIDPAIAQGYAYTSLVNPFVTVRLPIGIGDNRYTIHVAGTSYSVAAGELFDFRTHGLPHGTTSFVVKDIELDASLDPQDSSAFVTEVSFARTGRFEGKMRPLCAFPAPPGPIIGCQ